MGQKVRLVALMVIAEFSFWDPVRGLSRGPTSEYEHVLIGVFDAMPTADGLGTALDHVRDASAEAGGHAELHSYAWMDEDTWRRFRSPDGGIPDVVHGTGLDAVIHAHADLPAAIAAGLAAGATFLPAGAPDLADG